MSPQSPWLPLVLTLAVLAGCSSPVPQQPAPPASPSDSLAEPRPASAAGASAEPAPALRWWTQDVVLSTVGSAEAAGLYIHPASDLTPHNCASFDVGPGLRAVRAEARWAPDAAGPQPLVVFHSLLDAQGAVEDDGSAQGPSPLQHQGTLAGAGAGRYLFVGVEPPPSPVVSVGATPDVSLTIGLAYDLGAEPALRGLRGCSYP